MGGMEKVRIGHIRAFILGAITAILIALCLIMCNECRASVPTSEPVIETVEDIVVEESLRQYSDTISVNSRYAFSRYEFSEGDYLVYFEMEDESWWSSIVSKEVCHTIFAEDVDIMFAVDWDGDHTFMGFIY